MNFCYFLGNNKNPVMNIISAFFSIPAEKIMAQSLSRIYLHLAFSTKNRAPIIDANLQPRLWKYIGSVCKNLDCQPLKVGGHLDHVHILCMLSKNIHVVQFISKVKSYSSKWVKTQGEKYRNFYWQDGYGIFSVSPKSIDAVIEYIGNQEAHHQKRSFQDEFRQFLKQYGIEFDERYVWG
jgi:REP element-mobilizing transposase RayT